MNKYLGPIKWLGGIAVICIIFGIIFPSLRDSLITDERSRSGVLMQAVPFVAFFVAVLLQFILLIVIAAKRFNGKLHYRAYRPIELCIILGILGGVILLFQPFIFVAYTYGFTLLLVSTLAFILWSHVVPRHPKADADLPPFKPIHHIIAVVVALVVVTGLAVTAIEVNEPTAPYGIRQRLWDTYDEERKASIEAAARADFNNVQVPFLIFLNIFPGVILYFASREVAAALLSERKQQTSKPRRLATDTA